MPKRFKILCVGGGTMGSVTPLLAVAEELRLQHPDMVMEWWGTTTGPESVLLKHLGIPFRTLTAGKLRRYLSIQNLTDIVRIGIGFVQALWRFGLERPDVVLTAGSYAAVPAGFAAWLFGIPLCVHQMDVELGLANKLLAPWAALATYTFVGQHLRGAQREIVSGNPVRSKFLNPPNQATAQAQLGLEVGLFTLVVVGGGTGAQFFNNLIARTLPELTQTAQVVQVLGAQKKTKIATMPRYHAYSFALDTLTLLATADLVVTRGSMAFLTELGVLGKPSVIIPMPGTHQEANATYLEGHQAAVVLHEERLTDHEFVATVRKLLADAAARKQLGQNLAELFPRSAAKVVAEQVLAVLKERS